MGFLGIKMRHICLGLMIGLFGISLSAQEVILSQAQKIPSKITEFEIIGYTNEGLLIQKFGPKLNLIECFNRNDLSLRWAKQLILKGKRAQIIEVVTSGNDLLVFYYLKEGRYYNVYARRVDSKLKVKIKDTLILKARRKFGEQAFTFDLIYDKSHSWFIIQKSYRNSLTPYRFENVWLSPNLEVIDRKEFALEKLDWRYKQTIIKNNGTLYFVQGHIKRTLFTNTELYDLIRVEEYNPFLKESRTINISTKDQLLIDVKGDWDIYNQQLVFSGFYSFKQTSDLAGFFYITADFEQDTPKSGIIEFTSFDKTFIAEVNDQTMLSPSDRLRDIEVRHFILRSDGGGVLIGEAHSTDAGVGSRPFVFDDRFGNRSNSLLQYYYNDVVLFSVNPDGSKDWNKLLQKNQYSENDRGYFSSIGVMNSRYNINLLFNEYLSRRTTLNNYSINSQGENVISSIFDASNYKLSMAPRYAFQVSPSEIIIPSFNHRNEFLLAKIQY